MDIDFGFGPKRGKSKDIIGFDYLGSKPASTKKRVKLTPKERVYVWEHPKLYGRTCSICGHRITKLSDLELDHTKPYKQGGKKMNLAHRDCNRMKGSKSLKHIQKKLALKGTKRKTPKKSAKRKQTKRKPADPYGLGSFKMPKFRI